MSYSFDLINKKTKRPVKIRLSGIPQYGGTFACDFARGVPLDVDVVSFNVTYNYARIFNLPGVLGKKGIRGLYGLAFDKVLAKLYKARDAVVRMYKDKMDLEVDTGEPVVNDYWKVSPRNVVRTLDHIILVLNVVRTEKRNCENFVLDGD